MWAIQMAEGLNLNSFYGQHAVYELYTLLVFCVGLLEMRYLTQKIPGPRLTWFYEAYIQHEMKQFWVGWQDTVEEISRPFLSVSKEQIDYYLIHKEFSYIKKRSLSNYLDNQKKNLENTKNRTWAGWWWSVSTTFVLRSLLASIDRGTYICI